MKCLNWFFTLCPLHAHQLHSAVNILQLQLCCNLLRSEGEYCVVLQDPCSSLFVLYKVSIKKQEGTMKVIIMK